MTDAPAHWKTASHRVHRVFEKAALRGQAADFSNQDRWIKQQQNKLHRISSNLSTYILFVVLKVLALAFTAIALHAEPSAITVVLLVLSVVCLSLQCVWTYRSIWGRSSHERQVPDFDNEKVNHIIKVVICLLTIVSCVLQVILISLSQFVDTRPATNEILRLTSYVANISLSIAMASIDLYAIYKADDRRRSVQSYVVRRFKKDARGESD